MQGLRPCVSQDKVIEDMDRAWAVGLEHIESFKQSGYSTGWDLLTRRSWLLRAINRILDI